MTGSAPYQRLILVPPQTTPRGQVLEIVDTIAAKHDMTRADIFGRDRTQRFAAVRHEAMWEVKRLWPNLNHDQIGEIFGRRDRTTICNGIRQHRLALEARAAGSEPDLFARAA